MIWEHDRWWTYEEVSLRARRLAHFLVHECGVPKGARVALYWDNSADAIAASFGIWLAGGVLVALNTDLRDGDLAFQIRHSDATVVIAGRRQLRHLLPALPTETTGVATLVADGPLPPSESVPQRLVPWAQIVTDGPALADPVRTIDVDLAAIVYTSGSTGEPKGVMLSHLNLVSNMRSIVAYLELTEADRIMMILPHFYIYGLSLVLTHVLVGGSIVLDNRFMYPNTVLQTMAETRTTGFAGVPSTFSILLARSTVRETSLPALRYVTQAGGAMPPAVQQEVAAAFAPARLFVMYGATEAAPRLSYLSPDDLSRKWGSIGKPVDNVDLFVADQDGRPLSPGEEGEIVARGSNITAGYWKDPEASAEVLRDGLYFTGDLGVQDEEGFLFVTGRAKDIMKVKGFRVSPREIEERLVEIDGIAEAAVVAVPDELLGEAPVAVLVAANGDRPSEELLRAHMQKALPAYKQPRHYLYVDALPQGCGRQGAETTAHSTGSRGNYVTSQAEELLRIDPAEVTDEICQAMRSAISRTLRRQGAIVAISGGIDSSVTAALAVRALGQDRVIGLMMPERDSSSDTADLSRTLAESLGIRTDFEDISGILESVGCYARRDAAYKRTIPEYGPGWKAKIVLPPVTETPWGCATSRSSRSRRTARSTASDSPWTITSRWSPQRTSSSACARCSSTTTPIATTTPCAALPIGSSTTRASS